MKNIRCLAALFVATACLPALGEVDPAAIDKAIVQAMEQHKLPGLSVGVMHHGKVILVKGYGFASIQSREPVTSGTMFAAGSITKQFACVLALQLADEGRLSMDDRVSKYFPKAYRGGDVALMDLANHVSGYRDYYPLDFIDRAKAKPRAASLIVDEHVDSMEFEPGTRWVYSNTGFLMLGEVVARVAGAPLQQVLEQRVLRPLGMTHSAWEATPGRDGAAAGHRSFMLGDMQTTGDGEGKGWLGAAGGLWTTPGDLLAWDSAMMEGKLVSPASQRVLTTPRRLSNGLATDYACGLGIGNRGGMQTWAHLGAISGFTARNVMLPGSKSAVVLMTNVENMNQALIPLGVSIERMLLTSPASPPTVAGPSVLAAAAALMSEFQAGTPDRGRLAEEFSAFLTPARVQAAASSLARLGKPKTIEVTSVDLRGGFEHSVILFKFDAASAEAEMYRSPDGMVQQFLVSKK
jgi:D-alanyl-D-alanine carboxypeptidase